MVTDAPWGAGALVGAPFRPSVSEVRGFRAEHRFPSNLRLRTSLESRFLPRQPTLEQRITPVSVGVFGAVLGWRRDW